MASVLYKATIRSGNVNSNKGLTRELLDLKAKVMIEKMDKLYSMCNIVFGNSEVREVKTLEVIKEEYFQMYNKFIETGQYEKYKEVEDRIIKKIAKIEFNIDQYIYENNERIIKSNIDRIYRSENYQNFSNLEQEIQNIKILEQIFKLYSSCINKNEIEKLYNDISILKFNVLWRRQVEQLIYGNTQKKNILMQYGRQEERKCFIEQLEKKIKALPMEEVEIIEDDEIFRIEPETMEKQKKMRRKVQEIRKEENGITLVALVVTIIILLILAGVTVYFAVNGGLIGKVEEAVDKSNQAGQSETNVLNQAVSEIDKYLNGTGGTTTPEESRINIEYEFDKSTGTITGIKNKGSYYSGGWNETILIGSGTCILPGGTILVIPSEIDGVAVKAIKSSNPNGSGIFRQTNITKVVIPATVTQIGDASKNSVEFFACSFLEEVVIESKSVQIENGQFGQCPKLKK